LVRGAEVGAYEEREDDGVGLGGGLGVAIFWEEGDEKEDGLERCVDVDDVEEGPDRGEGGKGKRVGLGVTEDPDGEVRGFQFGAKV
jgi:hypothetical protein